MKEESNAIGITEEENENRCKRCGEKPAVQDGLCGGCCDELAHN